LGGAGDGSGASTAQIVIFGGHYNDGEKGEWNKGL